MTEKTTVSPFAAPYRSPSARDSQRLRDRYLKAVIAGNETEAAEVITQGVDAGWGPAALYLDVMASAMITVGDMWHDGAITIAHEHQATLITTRQMAVLKTMLPRAESTGLHAVVSAIEHDGHLVGAMIFADFLTFNGWDVDLVGTGVPVDDLARMIEERKPDLLGLSVTFEAGLSTARKTVQAIKSVSPSTKIVLGGSATVNFAEASEQVGADLVVTDALQAMVMIRQLFGLEEGSMPLDVILHRVGENVKSLRTAHGWSQQELADSAGLDRTYLSAVERGRQNLTLGAMKKLADALGSPITDLMTV